VPPYVRSFDYGGVHFVSLNTETDFEGAAEAEKGDSGIFDAGHFAPSGEHQRAGLVLAVTWFCVIRLGTRGLRVKGRHTALWISDDLLFELG
jgi:hypothetical protein